MHVSKPVADAFADADQANDLARRAGDHLHGITAALQTIDPDNDPDLYRELTDAATEAATVVAAMLSAYWAAIHTAANINYPATVVTYGQDAVTAAAVAAALPPMQNLYPTAS